MYSNAGSYGSRAKASSLSHFYDSELTATGAAYVRHVLKPEYTDPVGCPSLFPYNTTVIRLNTTTTVSTLKTNGLIVLQPNQGTSDSDALVQLTPTVAGAATLDDIALNLWAPLASMSTNFASGRIVAAVLKVQYIGAQDVASGFFAGAQIHSANGGGLDTTIDTLQEIIDNPKSIQTSWSEGVRVIWTPLDFADSDFAAIGGDFPSQTGKCYVAYSGFPTTGVLKVEAYITYELLPTVGSQILFPGRRYYDDPRAKQLASQLASQPMVMAMPDYASFNIDNYLAAGIGGLAGTAATSMFGPQAGAAAGALGYQIAKGAFSSVPSADVQLSNMSKGLTPTGGTGFDLPWMFKTV